MRPLLEKLPQYDYLYLGDNARVPYGGHSRENIQQFCEEAVEYLFSRGVTVILFACNTASAALSDTSRKNIYKGRRKESARSLASLSRWRKKRLKSVGRGLGLSVPKRRSIPKSTKLRSPKSILISLFTARPAPSLFHLSKRIGTKNLRPHRFSKNTSAPSSPATSTP